MIYKSHSATVPARTRGHAAVTCPKGSHVLGGGVTNPGGWAQAWVKSVLPIDGGDADSKPDDGYAGYVDNLTLEDLKVTAYAICGSGKFTRGLSYRRKTNPAVTNNTQGHVTASCRSGYKVVGGGVSSAAEFDDSAVNATRPEDGSDGGSKRDDAWIGFVDAFATEVPSIPITAYAICIKGKYAKGLRYKSASEEVNAQHQGAAVAKCGSRKVLGGGVTNPGGFEEGLVNSTRPEDGADSGSKRDDAWIGFVDNLDNNDVLKVTAFAICHK